jgi:hypothetical protein
VGTDVSRLKAETLVNAKRRIFPKTGTHTIVVHILQNIQTDE